MFVLKGLYQSPRQCIDIVGQAADFGVAMTGRYRQAISGHRVHPVQMAGHGADRANDEEQQGNDDAAGNQGQLPKQLQGGEADVFADALRNHRWIGG